MPAQLTLVEECWIDKQLHRVTDEEMIFKEEYDANELVKVVSKSNYDEKKIIPIMKLSLIDHLLLRGGRKYKVLHMVMKGD